MRLLATVLASLGMLVSPFAAALNTWGTDMSDLWFNPTESGWGANLSHQGEVIFMTLFVYGPDGRTRWYVADGLAIQSMTNAYVFSGPLYETTGPHFAGPFNPSAVGARQVGTASVSLFVNNGTITYSVDGATVTKQIVRQSFRGNNLAGNYIGAAVGTSTGCGATSGPFEGTVLYGVTHAGSSITITADLGNSRTCTFTGSYVQFGRMGDITGNISCSSGAKGTFDAYDLEAGYQGFFTYYTANYGGGCTETGRLGGVKR